MTPDPGTIAAAAGRSPSVRAVLARLVRRASRGVPLPGTVSAVGLGYAEQRALEALFGVVAKRAANGRVAIPLPAEVRDSPVWREVSAVFGLAPAGGAGQDGDVFARARLLEPERADAIAALAEKPEVARFLAKRENRRGWLRLFRGLAERLRGGDALPAATLSQLGSDWFGDSKKLRAGPWRRQLVVALAVLADLDSDDERGILARAGISENPYTASVAFLAPVAFRDADGTRFDFPAALFRKGRACQLPLATMETMVRAEWLSRAERVVATSENAAPFARLAAAGTPCVYVAGYPDSSVRRLLRLLADCGVECVHGGDADLDGFRIAAEIGEAIPLRGVVASDVLLHAPPGVGTEMTDAQKNRLASFAARHPGFRFHVDLERLARRGRWIEQEAFPSLLPREEPAP